MEMETMGKVSVRARIENLEDLYEAAKGALPAQKARAVEIDDALVDTGATMLWLPRRLIDQLGLRRHRTRTARTAAGTFSFGIYDAVRLTVHGRDCVVEVVEVAEVPEVPEGCPALIGQVPLELLDFVVDPVGQKRIGNPDHAGEQMIDLFHRCLD